MTPYEELEDAAAQLLDASHTEERKRYSGTPAWTRFAEEGYFARLANAVRRVRVNEKDRVEKLLKCSVCGLPISVPFLHHHD